jgi:Double zinc ribbon/Pseudomurein-binding repeat
MICPKCGHKNDIDADFCENCGAKIKETADNKPYTNNSSKESISKSTKLLIVICVVLVIGIGIAVGVLIKNNLEKSPVQSVTNSSADQITNSSGFPLSQTSNLAVQIAKYNGNIGSVNYGSITLDQNQCLYILSKAIVMINNNETGNIPIKSIQTASSPEGTVTSGTIAQSDYVNVATRTYTWIDNYGRSPNYVGIKNPGQPDLSPTMTLDLFSKVLSEYNSTGQLPQSVSIP